MLIPGRKTKFWLNYKESVFKTNVPNEIEHIPHIKIDRWGIDIGCIRVDRDAMDKLVASWVEFQKDDVVVQQ